MTNSLLSFQNLLVLAGVVLLVILYLRKLALPGARHEIRVSPKGLSYLWSFHPGFSYAAPRYEVSIETPVPMEFTLEPESRSQKAVKWLGFATEFQTGDEVFDRKVYIGSDDPGFCERLQASKPLRDAILRALKTTDPHAYKSLSCKNGRLRLFIHNPAEQPNSQRIDSYLDKLGEIGLLLPGAAMAQPHKLRRQAQYFSMLFRWLLFAGLILSLINTMHTADVLHPFKMVRLAFKLWLGTTIIALFYIRFLFRKSALGYNVIRSFVKYGLAGFALSYFGLVYQYNIYGDKTVAESFTQLIQSKYIKQGTTGTLYYNLVVQDWHPVPGGAEQRLVPLLVGKDFYDSVLPGESLVLHTHPGALGYEWIEDYHLRKADE